MFENFTREQTAIVADALLVFLTSDDVGADGTYRRTAEALYREAKIAAEQKADIEASDRRMRNVAEALSEMTA